MSPMSVLLWEKDHCGTHSPSQGKVNQGKGRYQQSGPFIFVAKVLFSCRVTLLALVILQRSFKFSHVRCKKKKKSCSPVCTEVVNEQRATMLRLLKVLYLQRAFIDLLSATG